MRILTGLWGAILEAWAELRIHKTRVLLSLVGVSVAVAALTAVVAFGQLAERATIEQFERGGGRPAMLSVYAYSTGSQMLSTAETDAAFQTAVDRYSIEYSSRNTYMDGQIQFATGVESAGGQVVDVDFGTMHRFSVDDGRWFVEADNNRLAPAIIVNEVFWKKLGSPDLSTHPTAKLLGANPTIAVIVGVTGSPEWDTYPSFMMLYSSYQRVASPLMLSQQAPNYEMWVPPEMATELSPLIQRDMAGALGDEAQVDVTRNDYLAQGSGGVEDSLAILKLMITGGALLVLLLGSLGLVTISLVTLKQRIREIGIRRSFGATAGRVFFAVMMESIVATFVAGAVGVILGVLIVQSPLVQDVVSQGVVDLPPFPVEAAIIGILSSVAVGALAGLLPALVAVRVKVIDAIRY